MTRTPDRQPDEPRPRRLLRWLGRSVGWIGRVRPRGWVTRVVAHVWILGRRRLLFLDDDPKRAEQFLKEHPRAVWVTTVPDCLDRLAECWDEVHLDHDLGGKTFVDSSQEDCGMEVIRWLRKETRPHLQRTSFFVHTHNATAGLLMVLLMRGGGYKAEFRPFGLDLEKLLAHNETSPMPAPEEQSGPRPESGRPGWYRSLRIWATTMMKALASRSSPVRSGGTICEGSTEAVAEVGSGPDPTAPRAMPPAEFGHASDGPEPGASISAQPVLPGSAPVIQPPPSTKSS